MTPKSFPYRKQETDFYCGPAIVQMALATQGTDISQNELAASMGTSEHGTPLTEIERVLALHGFVTIRKNNAAWEDIDDALQKGMMVIIGYVEPEEEVAHYSFVASTNDEAIYFVDPLFGPDFTMSREEFEKRWRDDEDGAYGERMMLVVSIPKV